MTKTVWPLRLAVAALPKLSYPNVYARCSSSGRAKCCCKSRPSTYVVAAAAAAAAAGTCVPAASIGPVAPSSPRATDIAALRIKWLSLPLLAPKRLRKLLNPERQRPAMAHTTAKTSCRSRTKRHALIDAVGQAQSSAALCYCTAAPLHGCSMALALFHGSKNIVHVKAYRLPRIVGIGCNHCGMNRHAWEASIGSLATCRRVTKWRPALLGMHCTVCSTKSGASAGRAAVALQRITPSTAQSLLC